MFKLRSTLIITVLFALAIIVSACQPAASPEAESDANQAALEAAESMAEESMEKTVIRFADVQWQTLWINNAIAMYIVEHGYGYPVESIEMTTPVYQQTIVDGGVDVMMENWTGNIEDWWNEVTSNGTVLDLGNTFNESGQGFYVPRYVIEGDASRGIEASAPDLKSVFDLPEYKDVFKDTENSDKGLLINCITGWDCANVNRVKLHAYGLAEDYNIMEPGAAAALDAAIAGAYKKGEPILSYYWEPTWLIGLYDMVKLEEPEYSDECWADNKKVTGGEVAIEDVTESAGCAYETVGIPKSAAASLMDRAPEVVDFLSKMNLSNDELNKTAAYMETEEISAEEAARWFFDNYTDSWKSWVTEDAAAKIEAALSEGK